MCEELDIEGTYFVHGKPKTIKLIDIPSVYYAAFAWSAVVTPFELEFKDWAWRRVSEAVEIHAVCEEAALEASTMKDVYEGYTANA